MRYLDVSDTRAPLLKQVLQRSNSKGKVVFFLLLCCPHRDDRTSEKMAYIVGQGSVFFLLKKVDESRLREDRE